MKSLLFGLVFLLVSCSPARAGSASCSNVTHLTEAQVYYNANEAECVLSVEKSVFQETLIYLPPSPSTNDEFTVQDATAFELDDCQNYGDEETGPLWICSPAGVTVHGNGHDINSGEEIGSAQSATLAGMYYQGSPARQRVKVVFNGSEWVAQYSWY